MKKIIFSLLVSCAIASAAFTVDRNTATAAVRGFLTNKDARAIELIFKNGNTYLLSDTLTSIVIVDGGGLGITLKELIKLTILSGGGGSALSDLAISLDKIEQYIMQTVYFPFLSMISSIYDSFSFHNHSACKKPFKMIQFLSKIL